MEIGHQTSFICKPLVAELIWFYSRLLPLRLQGRVTQRELRISTRFLADCVCGTVPIIGPILTFTEVDIIGRIFCINYHQYLPSERWWWLAKELTVYPSVNVEACCFAPLSFNSVCWYFMYIILAHFSLKQTAPHKGSVCQWIKSINVDQLSPVGCQLCLCCRWTNTSEPHATMFHWKTPLYMMIGRARDLYGTVDHPCHFCCDFGAGLSAFSSTSMASYHLGPAA